jgi:hypothetical protein
MFNFKVHKHKNILREAFSNCFDPMHDELGNVPVKMQDSRKITASILGICRAYTTAHQLNEDSLNIIVDAVFEELFRRESVEVQSKAEHWLQTEDEEFMKDYFFAKEKTLSDGLRLDWLTDYSKQNFQVVSQVMFDMQLTSTAVRLDVRNKKADDKTP